MDWSVAMPGGVPAIPTLSVSGVDLMGTITITPLAYTVKNGM